MENQLLQTKNNIKLHALRVYLNHLLEEHKIASGEELLELIIDDMRELRKQQ